MKRIILILIGILTYTLTNGHTYSSIREVIKKVMKEECGRFAKFVILCYRTRNQRPNTILQTRTAKNG